MFEQFLQNLVDFAQTNIEGLTLFVPLAVALLKRIPQLDFIPADRLNIIVALAMLMFALIADNFDMLDQFENVLQAVTAILSALVGLSITSAGVYHIARFANVPVLKYSRGDNA